MYKFLISLVACIVIFICLEGVLGDESIELSNDCSNDSSVGCTDTQNLANYIYGLTSYSKATEENDRGDYDFDKLSDRDYTIFDSKSPEYWRAADQETTLRQVLMIHRHGDRTPITFAPKDKLAGESFWTFHGLGQLTNRGKARLNMLGEIIRMRYDKFFAGSVNKNQRKTRASGALRCIESAQVFLSSLLRLDQANTTDAKDLYWDRSENKLGRMWQPISVNTLAAKIDGMLNEGAACAAADDEYKLIDSSAESKQINEEFRAESKLLKNVLGFDTDNFYKWFWASSFIEVELSYFKEKVDPRLRQAYDRIEKAGNRALVLYQSTLLAKRLRSGLLINDMIENMKIFRKNAKDYVTSDIFNKKFVHYSAHDLNLVVLLELHQDGDEWFVKLFYMQHVPSKPIELQIASCIAGNPNNRCLLENFESTLEQYKIKSWQDWMKECRNPMALVDPYEQNP